MDAKNIESIYALTPVQRGILFHTVFDPASRAYFNQLAFKVTGLDAAAFRSAWRGLVERHAVLRTSFHWEDLERPVQVVHRQVELQISEQDFSGLEPGEQLRQVKAFRAQERSKGFNLAQAPVLRLGLFRLGDADTGSSHQIVLSYSHLLLDAWSTHLLFRELFFLYDAHRAGRPAQLPPPPAFREFVAWVGKRDKQEELAFWRRSLAGLHAATPLPGEQWRSSPPQVSSDFGEVWRHLSPDLTRAIDTLARAQGASVSEVLHAAWMLLLQRHSGQSDVVVGTTVAGRSASVPGVENMVGLLINTLPVRLRLEPDWTVSALLKAVHHAFSELLPHAQTPLVELQALAGLPRNAPLMNSLVVVENLPVDASVQARGEALRDLEQEEQSNFALTLVAHLDASLGLLLAHDLARFSKAQAERILARLETLLDGMTRHPTRRLDQLELLPSPERHTLLHDWNQPRVEGTPPTAGTVHGLVEAQAQRTPEAIAVAMGDTQLTYRALEDGANRLAHHLMSLGAGPDQVIAVAAGPSTEGILALVAVLKAGSGYLPLDPEQPEARLRFILQDAGVQLLITSRTSAPAFEKAGARLVFLEDPLPADEAYRKRPAVHVHPENLAYVVYTSGSTGEPKGVQVPHRAVVNHNVAVARQFGLGAGDRVLQFTPLHFDAAVEEIFPPLITGATVVVRGELVPADAFNDLLRRERLTVLSLPPAFLHAWVAELAQRQERVPQEVRLVLLGGEKIPPESYRLWQSVGGASIPWINVYGPTEATVTSAMSRISTFTSGEPILPIGSPIANGRLYLVDEQLRPVPLGEPGELLIGGLGVTRGYLGRPDLTAQKFLPDPFDPIPGRRVYRTGDVARHLEDGQLEFLGRVDNQVKLRGHRIELEEIEAVLRRARGVQEAVVRVQPEPSGEGRLVAYVVTGQEPAPRAWRQAVRAALPDYMVPSAFVPLERLPLTANGKIDFRALPPAPAGGVSLPGSRTPPRPGHEARIASIFQEVLGVPTVGADDDFFELGGHSLLAMQVVSRIRKASGVELSLRTLFENPTPQSLGRWWEAQEKGQDAPALPALVALPRDARLTFAQSFAQQRLWFLFQLEPQSRSYNVPLALRINGPLDVALLERCVEALVKRHEALRTTFANQEGKAVQRIHPDMPVLQPRVDLSTLPAEHREARARQLASEAANTFFDLSTGPLLRVSVLRLAGDDHVLLWVMHHIVTDGWSSGILVSELSELYTRGQQKQPLQLPPLPLQYADYAVWQRQWLRGDTLKAQTDFWKKELEGAPAVLDLPTDFPRQNLAQRRVNARQPLAITGRLAAQLKEVAHREGATLFMAVLAGFAALLQRYSGSNDIVCGTVVANRDQPGTEQTVGFFINQLPIRANLEGDPDFSTLLARVRERSLSAFAHQHLPFEELVVAINPERSLTHAPLFQVMVMVDSAAPQGKDIPGLEISAFDPDPGELPFDLLLSLGETPEGLFGNLNFSQDLFEPATVAAMAGHLQTLLDHATASPKVPLSQLALHSSEQRRRILSEWNDTAQPLPDVLVHQLFEAQVDRTPDALAVVHGDRKLTYRQLNSRANALARQLVSLGVGPEQKVALLAEPSLEAITALYAVLKAGGAYVPLDTGAPAERLAFILQDAGSPVILSQPAFDALLSQAAAGRRVVMLPPSETEPPPEQAKNLPARSVPANLAYVVYTSGSTGEPKGVLVPHRALVNHNLAVIRRFGMGPEDRLLQFTPLNFDAAGEEIYPPLASGGSFQIQADLLPHTQLKALVEREKLTILSLPPAYLHGWMTHLDREGERIPTSLRRVLAGGEKLLPETFALWKKWGGGAIPWINVYGPTEATITATCCEISGEGFNVPVLPIGRPLANVRAYVVDARLQLVPLGVPGELVLGGAGLARGYLGRPDLTAASFVPDGLSGISGGMLYRTGDLVRQRPDGQLEVLGRIDHQVKIRGHRIELGEVESALLKHPQVEQAVVVANDDRPDRKRLFGFVASQAAGLSSQELRAHLSRTLPDYMIPHDVVVLAKLPLTPNGKVDRRALPFPTAPSAAAGVLTPPRTSEEAALAGLWSELLNLPAVGITQSFFELGGHSMMAMEMLSLIENRLHQQLDLAAFFQQPTIEHMAASLQPLQDRGGRRWSPLLALQPRGEGRPFFFVHPNGGDVAPYYALAQAVGTGQPFYGLQAPGLEEGQTPLETVEALASLYVDALLEQQPTGPFRLGGYSMGGTIAYQMAGELKARGREVSVLVVVDTATQALQQQLSREGPLAGLTPEKVTKDTVVKNLCLQAGVPAVEVEALSPPERLERCLEALFAANELPRSTPRAAIERRIAVIAAHLKASLRHVQRPLGHKVSLFVSQESRELWEVTLGWGELCPGDVTVGLIEGTHHTLLRPPFVDALGEKLRKLLQA